MLNSTDPVHRFAEAFQSEDALRKDIATLLNKMPHTQGVQITHGSQEYGKDIIFYAPDGFHNWQLNACVVKRTKISGSVDDNEGARTVFSQAEQALDTPFINAAGEEELVAKVFIISPFDCSQSTIRSIQGKLKSNFGRVEFLCGSRLFEKFSTYWPEFVIFESTLLGAYVVSLQRSFDQADPINFLAAQHSILSSAGKTLRSVYVRQGFKISLQQFDLLVDQPNLQALGSAVRRSDVDDLREQLGFVANLIRHVQVWEVPNAQASAILAESLMQVSKCLQEEWERLEQERRDRERLEQEKLVRDRSDRERLEREERMRAILERARRGGGKVDPSDMRRQQLDRERLERERLEQERGEQRGTLRGKAISSKDDREIEVNHFAHIVNTPAISQMMAVLSSFKARVDEANQFVKTAIRAKVDLHSQQYLNYVRVREVVRLNPVAFRKSSQVREEHFAETLLDEIKGPMLITAPAGYGKTSFCKWNTLNDVQALVDKTATMIPIYVPLHQLATASIKTCEEAFFRSVEVTQLVSTARSCGQGVRIYLDGLDEVTTIEQQERLMRLARELADKYPLIQIVVTGRDYVSGPWLRWLSRIHLSELNDRQVTQPIDNWLGQGTADCDDFNKQLSRTRTLEPLMHVPLLGTLIIAVYKRLRSLPESKSKLYEIFVELMCGGWDLAKNVRRETRFGSQAKLGVLTRLAGVLHSDEKREAQEGAVRLAVSQTMATFLDQWRGILDEILEDGLLIRVGSDSLAFSHLSFQEYLAAGELTDPNGDRQQQILKRYLSGEDWWREVLAFYMGMSRRPDETEAWLRKTAIDMSSSSRVHDLSQRFNFLVDALASAWPAWSPKERPPMLTRTYVEHVAGRTSPK